MTIIIQVDRLEFMSVQQESMSKSERFIKKSPSLYQEFVTGGKFISLIGKN